MVSQTQGLPDSRNSTTYAQATWSCKITSEQASADLLKSCWILDNVLLQHEKSNTEVEEGIMKLIQDLMPVSEKRGNKNDVTLLHRNDLTSRLGP